MGGSEMNDNYTLKSTTLHKINTQLHNLKQSRFLQRILINARQNSSSIAFKSNHDTHTNCTNKHNKEGFITALEEHVAFNGLQNMISIPNRNGVIHSLVQYCHLFDLKEVITRFNSILETPTAEYL